MTAHIKTLAIGIALAVLLAAFAWQRDHYIGVGEARVEALWHAQQQADALAAAQQHAQVQAQALEREQRERQKEQAMQLETERIANENAQLQAALADSRRGAVDAGRMLNTTIAALRADLRAARDTGGASASAAAAVERASTATELLGTCAGRYTSVAADADQLAIRLSGLQDFAASVCRAPMDGGAQ